MPTIGITGGVATGKSTVAALFGERGAVVLSADEAAREVVQAGSPALGAIAETFGPDYILPSGELDRSKMGALVFADAEARRKLEAITHPAILQRLRSQIEQILKDRPDALIAVEVPLLYEAGMESWFDQVVVVTVDEQTQVERLVQRGGMTEEAARFRIGAQIPLAEKAARADFVVHNEGSLADAATQVDAIISGLAGNKAEPGK